MKYNPFTRGSGSYKHVLHRELESYLSVKVAHCHNPVSDALAVRRGFITESKAATGDHQEVFEPSLHSAKLNQDRVVVLLAEPPRYTVASARQKKIVA